MRDNVLNTSFPEDYLIKVKTSERSSKHPHESKVANKAGAGADSPRKPRKTRKKNAVPPPSLGDNINA